MDTSIRRMRGKFGQCLQCGHDLAGKKPGVCPECGMDSNKNRWGAFRFDGQI